MTGRQQAQATSSVVFDLPALDHDVRMSRLEASLYSKAKTTMGDEVHRYSSTSGLPWEIPVLLKCRLSTGSFRPFVALGPSFRLVKGSVPGASAYGVTAGGGVEFRFKKIRISPAMRYTRWAPTSPELPSDRVQVVVGLSI